MMAGSIHRLHSHRPPRTEGAAESIVPPLDAYDTPAILLGNDMRAALETRSVLQSLGFDVLCGSGLMDADEDPVLVVMQDYLEQRQNLQRIEQIRKAWPLAPVFFVSHPADAASQLRRFLS